MTTRTDKHGKFELKGTPKISLTVSVEKKHWCWERIQQVVHRKDDWRIQKHHVTFKQIGYEFTYTAQQTM